MKIEKIKIPDVYIIKPDIYGDKRGYYMVSYNYFELNEKIGDFNFIQDAESKSKYGALRGLHYQIPPYSQAKLVRVVSGRVLDVIVDIRTDSLTYGHHYSTILSDENKKMILIPRGFAHGYVTLSNEAIFQYKVDNIYAPDFENGIIYNDKKLNIDWNIPNEDIIISDKDLNLLGFMCRTFYTKYYYNINPE